MKRSLISCGAMALALVGCGAGGGGGGDGGGGADMAVRPSPPLYQEDTKTMVKTTLPPSEFACGNAEGPGPDKDTEIEGKIQDFQDDNLIRGATIKVYKDTADALADKPLAMTTSDKEGKYKLTIPKGAPARLVWYNVNGKAVKDGNELETIPTYEFNYRWDDKDRIGVKVSTREAIPGLVSVIPDLERGVLAGGVRTCSGKDVGGARVKISGYPMVPDFDPDQLTFYFVEVSGSTLPTRTQKWTSGNGSFATLNVPPSEKPVTVTVTGAIGEGGAVKTLSEGGAPVVKGAITILEMMPFADGPR